MLWKIFTFWQQSLSGCNHIVDFTIIKSTWTCLINCQKEQGSHLVYLKTHTTTNLYKFWLNWSSKLQGNNERKNTLVQICVLSDAFLKASGLKFLNILVRNYLFLKKKTCYFIRGSSFSECFITALHCLLPGKFLG